MHHHGFLRVAAACPSLALADPAANAAATLELLRQLAADGCQVAALPELGLTGYTCGDLFHQSLLQTAALDALVWLAEESRSLDILYFVGLPLALDGRLYNCAAGVSRGSILGVVPKTHLPNYQEFYEARHFSPAATARADRVTLRGRSVPFGTDLLFAAGGFPACKVGVEICEDLWVPSPPSSGAALAGATVLFNLSGSNEGVGKAGYRRQLVATQSAKCIAAYVYSGTGTGESTTDLVFGGHCLIAENGVVLAESARFLRTPHAVVADVDVDRLARDRQLTTSFGMSARESGREVEFAAAAQPTPWSLKRTVDPHPFVPAQPETLEERCQEVLNVQSAALARRLLHAGTPPVAIGVSGGLDSTLALVVLVKALWEIGQSADTIIALTMPGFGTSAATLDNARRLCDSLGVKLREIDIRAASLEQLRLIGHDPFGLDVHTLTADNFAERYKSVSADRRQDLVFENVQARLRTSLLMNRGFALGTGDLSELALGWCTYNADQMSMYHVNAGVPKTLVRFLIRYVARHESSEESRRVLTDIADAVISPELLPATDGGVQSTEATVGPYELHDFFLYHTLRLGMPPAKVFALAKCAAFDRDHTPGEIKAWLKVFYARFFAQQYKRSAMPDGPKVGSVSLSPRGDWRMPSDASSAAWLAAVDAIKMND